ncbi:MAG TPA: hypothetical protein VLL52_18940 [Anaerolineae bacterium]|nr:hypothetical protein [Anaerolineae bacterium]
MLGHKKDTILRKVLRTLRFSRLRHEEKRPERQEAMRQQLGQLRQISRRSQPQPASEVLQNKLKQIQ